MTKNITFPEDTYEGSIKHNSQTSMLLMSSLCFIHLLSDETKSNKRNRQTADIPNFKFILVKSSNKHSKE